MLKVEGYAVPSVEQWALSIRGMRNPKNSWDRTDTLINREYGIELIEVGKNDLKLMKTLSDAGTEHRKYMRMLPVIVEINAPLYWWKEFDTYKVGTVANSCSTMHKIASKQFEIEDFSHEELNEASLSCLLKTIECLNYHRKQYNEMKRKQDWWQLIQLLPSSFNQKRTVMINYEVAMNILRQRRNHKLTEWHTFCDFLEKLPYMKEFV